MIIISDTSPISNLVQIGRLNLLSELFGEVIIPGAVDKEIEALEGFGVDIELYRRSSWIIVKSPQNKELLSELSQELDIGESEAITLAVELSAKYLLIDERLGTQRAIKEGVQTIGLIGVLIIAKRKQLIGGVKPILDELISVAGFWIGDKLYNRILREVNET